MVKRGIRAWICECGQVKPREKGQSAILCKCGAKMKKSRLQPETLKKGKVEVEERPTKQAKSPKGIKPAQVDSSTLLKNFRLYWGQCKVTATHETWWSHVFPKQPYPKSKSAFMTALKIEYALAMAEIEEKELPISAQFQKNFDAAMAMNKDGLSKTLQKLVESYDNAAKNKQDKYDSLVMKKMEGGR